MNYKTIALELIRQDPGLYERLRSSKRLLPAMDSYAADLKAAHDRWKRAMGRDRPHGDPTRTASEALELAVQELRDRLSCESPEGMAGTPSRDGATIPLGKGSPPG